MSILFRHVLREFTSAWLIVLFALSVMLCGSQFARALERAADAHLPNDIVPHLLLATVVQSLPITGALSLVIGIALAVGRLCHDSEFGAMSAAGLGIWRISRPILLVAICFSLVIAWLTLVLVPQMASREQALLAAGYRGAQLAAFQPGRFTQLPNSGTVVHVRARDADGMLRQLVIARRDAQRIEVITARRAKIIAHADGRGISVMAFDGLRAEGVPGEGAARLVRFATLTTQLELGDVRRNRASRDFLPSSELLASDKPQDAAELQWRWSLPLMCLILACLSLPLSRLRPRQSRYARLFPVLALFFLYINSLIGARNAIARGNFAMMQGMWVVHAAFLAIGSLAIGWPIIQRRWGRGR